MLRRQFIAGAATFALSARPLRTHAQQSATGRTRIGILIYGTLENNPSTQALLEGFRELGYVDGQNLTIDTAMLRVGQSGFLNWRRIWSRASPL